MDKKIAENINSGVNVIIARFIMAVFAVIVLVAVLTFTGVFLITTEQIYILLLAAAPGAILSLLVLVSERARKDRRTKYALCVLMCLQTFAVAMAGYSYAGTTILLLPIFLSALYPRTRAGSIVSAVMIFFGLILPPLALITGLWDGGYYEFLYDLTYGRQMDTSILSDEMLSLPEQILSAVRFCSSQNVLIVGGYAVIGRLIYRQTNRSFESQKDVIRLSETDELTGLLNRNCFERRLVELEAFRANSPVCFYFDVNGLHEMNNTHGHKAGDTMLQFVGKEIQKVFGEENTFRVGGDEFVAFSGKLEPQVLSERKKSLENAFTSQGYHVSVGYAQSTAEESVNELIQRAEKEMYQAKNEYYSTQNCQNRRRGNVSFASGPESQRGLLYEGSH